MNDETLQTEELPVPEAETSAAVETAVDEAADGAVIYEDLAGAAIEETTAEVVITLEEIQAVGSDIVHADLFGSFLVCGTLIAMTLFRGRYGS